MNGLFQLVPPGTGDLGLSGTLVKYFRLGITLAVNCSPGFPIPAFILGELAVQCCCNTITC